MKVLKNAKFTGNIKINDTNTDIYFEAYDDGVLQKLDASQCSFRIKNDTGYLITISNVSTETDYITFKSNELKPLPVGTYYLELWVEDSTGTYIYPDESFCKLRINENVTVAQGTTIPTISLEEYENKLQGYVDNAVADGKTEIKDDFDKYVDSITDSTIATATKASQDAATAINTANSANAAAQNATNIANAAKSNADSASQAAATAQSTADSAKQAASNAQSTADNALSVANNALSTAQDNSSKISNLSTSFSASFQGTRNLLRKSGTLDTPLYKDVGTIQSDKFMNANVYEQHGTWKGLLIYINDLYSRNLVNTYDDYVLSFYIKVDNNSYKLSNFSYFNNSNDVFSNYSQINSAWIEQSLLRASNEWIQIQIPLKFTDNAISSSSYIGIWFSQSYTAGNVYWSCPKIEKGTKASDYTPAPEDIDDEIDAIKTQIQVLTNN